ncbi:hypothetical protein CLOP_g12761 [Closterium sp. NIES-67]|nr:hypothetical protein CLOP_g12761 [Closterium sp. NIES-67]
MASEGFARPRWLSHIVSHAPDLVVLSLNGPDFQQDSLDIVTSLKSLEELELECPRLKSDWTTCLTSLGYLQKLTLTVDASFRDTLSSQRLRFLCLKSDSRRERYIQVYRTGFDLKLDLPALETLQLDCVARLLVSNSPLLKHVEVDCLNNDYSGASSSGADESSLKFCASGS